MSVIAIPTPKSENVLSIPSLVILFLTSSTTTSPVLSGRAYVIVGFGLELGLSLSNCGNKSLIGCEKAKLSLSLNGDIVGVLDASTTVK